MQVDDMVRVHAVGDTDNNRIGRIAEVRNVKGQPMYMVDFGKGVRNEDGYLIHAAVYTDDELVLVGVK
jgi:tRNA A37 N6-isopentenylltransferase MiaA